MLRVLTMEFFEFTGSCVPQLLVGIDIKIDDQIAGFQKSGKVAIGFFIKQKHRTFYGENDFY